MQGIDGAPIPSQKPGERMVTTRIICADLAGLRAQAVGLAEAAGFADAAILPLRMRRPWNRLSPAFWVAPRLAVQTEIFGPPAPDIVFGAGGAGARIAAALRGPHTKAVAIQHPRMALEKFDVVLAAAHDGIAGSNVIVTRTALHRVTAARLAAERAVWAPVFAAHKRPLLAVLLGGSNGRYELGPSQALEFALLLHAMMRREDCGLLITGSRRTDPAVLAIIEKILTPLGAWVWDGTGENPYFGMLACADAIIVTADSVSMVSEAVATAAPVLLLRLPGKSNRIGAFMDSLVAVGRVRNFAGRLELWDTEPLNDTELAGAELRRRLGFE
jgi:mitochondrial fission protein ELM1